MEAAGDFPIFCYFFHCFFIIFSDDFYRDRWYDRVFEFGLSNPEYFSAMIPFYANLTADYFALFFIRKCISAFGDRLILSLVLGTVVAILIVYLVYFLYCGAALIYELVLNCNSFGWDMNVIRPTLNGAMKFTKFVMFPSEPPFFVIPALLVYIWLPIFAFSALFARGITMILVTINWAQWFLKQGNQHPLRAIGVVASALVFVAITGLELFR